MEVVFISETDDRLRNHNCTVWTNDRREMTEGRRVIGNIMERPNSFTVACDVYICGFPCQPHSTAGKRMHANDAISEVLDYVMNYVTKAKAPIVMLENVRGYADRANAKRTRLAAEALQEHQSTEQ